MDPKVRWQWHRTTRDLVADLFELSFLFFLIERIEAAKVKLLSTLHYVILNEPAKRLDICVPRVNRLMRMTVVAGAADDQRNIRWDGYRRLQGLAGINWRIGLIDPEELDPHQNDAQQDGDDLYELFQHR